MEEDNTDPELVSNYEIVEVMLETTVLSLILPITIALIQYFTI